jgi:hypothetical protein
VSDEEQWTDSDNDSDNNSDDGSDNDSDNNSDDGSDNDSDNGSDDGSDDGSGDAANDDDETDKSGDFRGDDQENERGGATVSTRKLAATTDKELLQRLPRLDANPDGGVRRSWLAEHRDTLEELRVRNVRAPGKNGEYILITRKFQAKGNHLHLVSGLQV